MTTEGLIQLLKTHPGARIEWHTREEGRLQRTHVFQEATFDVDKNVVTLIGVEPLVDSSRISDREYDQRYSAYEKFWNALTLRGTRRMVLAMVLPESQRLGDMVGEIPREHEDDRWDELSLDLQKLIMLHVDMTKKLEGVRV